MLSFLTIRQYALIEELSVEFTGGLNVLTGETGAGKSIIIDALALVLGERASGDVVRTGAAKAVIEAGFNVSGNRKVRALLEKHGLDESDELILRREVAGKGQNRCFINDTPVQLSVLKLAGDVLVDLHGQHEHQSLLRPATHMEILDSFGGVTDDLPKYQSAFARLLRLTQGYQDLSNRSREFREKEDLYRYQLAEIDAVAPALGEEERLLGEERILKNLEKLAKTVAGVSDILYGGEQSVHDLLSILDSRLRQLMEIDPRFGEPLGEIESARAIVEELSRFVREYSANLEFTPGRLEEVLGRLAKMSMLKKKYGGSAETILARREMIAGELGRVEDLDVTKERLEKEIAEVREECLGLAKKLSAKRAATARRVEKEVVKELETLGIQSAEMEVQIASGEGTPPAEGPPDPMHANQNGMLARLTDRGIDDVEFLISLNAGEELKPLAKVASGGEISRIMLALKGILANYDRLPVVVFDEIDVGVSGRIAHAVGRSLKRLSKTHQVIAITHLPQIAGLADAHFAVTKSENGNRTQTLLRKLETRERVIEVARLLSGEKVTEAALTGARELIGLSQEA